MDYKENIWNLDEFKALHNAICVMFYKLDIVNTTFDNIITYSCFPEKREKINKDIAFSISFLDEQYLQYLNDELEVLNKNLNKLKENEVYKKYL